MILPFSYHSQGPCIPQPQAKQLEIYFLPLYLFILYIFLNGTRLFLSNLPSSQSHPRTGAWQLLFDQPVVCFRHTHYIAQGFII